MKGHSTMLPIASELYDYLNTPIIDLPPQSPEPKKFYALPMTNSHVLEPSIPDKEWQSEDEYQQYENYVHAKTLIKANKRTQIQRAEIVQEAILDAFLGVTDDKEKMVQYVQTLMLAEPKLATDILLKTVSSLKKDQRLQTQTQIEGHKPAPIIIQVKGEAKIQQNIDMGPQKQTHIQAEKTLRSSKETLRSSKETLCNLPGSGFDDT